MSSSFLISSFSGLAILPGVMRVYGTSSCTWARRLIEFVYWHSTWPGTSSLLLLRAGSLISEQFKGSISDAAAYTTYWTSSTRCLCATQMQHLFHYHTIRSSHVLHILNSYKCPTVIRAFSFTHKMTACSTFCQEFMAPMKLASLTSITRLVQSHSFLYLFVPTGVSPTVDEIHQLGFQLLCRLCVLWPLAAL